MIRAIASDNFPPFGEFELRLLPVEKKPAELGEVHLFTGVNGTGKTRLLSIIAMILGSDVALRKRLKGSTAVISIYAANSVPPTNTALNQWRGLSSAGWFTLR
jgi:predicted ATPase